MKRFQTEMYTDRIRELSESETRSDQGGEGSDQEFAQARGFYFSVMWACV